MQRLAVTCMLDHVRLLLETHRIVFICLLMRRNAFSDTHKNRRNAVNNVAPLYNNC